MYSTSSTPSQLLRDFLTNFHSRKLLLSYKPQNQPSLMAAAATPPPDSHNTNIDANVFMLLSVLFCGIICSLGLNFTIRCALRCTARAGSESNDNPSAVATMNRGIERKVLRTFPVVNYSEKMNLPVWDSVCVICLSEFVGGERLRILPKCNHGFHVGCIDKWLKSHSSCPKCRHCLIETCRKITGRNQTSSSQSRLPTEEINENILPVEHESMVRGYR